MHKLKVKLKKRSYDILVGNNILRFLGGYVRKLNPGKDAYIITNAFLKKRYGRAISSALKKSAISFRFGLVADTEKSKSIETASRVIREITAYDRNKRLFIIAFGGGVVGDLAGFIASVYKRGIAYLQVPTTLLAQVDSAIGGKTAVDLSEGKNLLGAFYQPRLVLSDVALLKTLDKKQLAAGLAEVIKYAAIKDPALFSYLEKHLKDIFALKPAALEFVVARCSRIKADIVSRDEKEEKGLRTMLNFGHTIGHAIEAAGNYRGYNHGQAVALGMLAACSIARRIGLAKGSCREKLESLIKSSGLPLKIRGVSPARIIRAHYRDKKFIGSRNKFVLIKDIGQCRIKTNIPLKLIREAIRERS